MTQKQATFLALLLFLSGAVFGQDNFINNIINNTITKCINLLDNPVSDEFRRINRTTFTNDDIILIVENDIVIMSSLGIARETTNEVSDFTSMFYNYFENNGWEYLYSGSNGSDLYTKNEIFAVITRPSRRSDGFIAASIIFSRRQIIFER